MPNDYSLTDLSKLADVSPRTVRYYIAQGLLPAPVGQGPAARYNDGHLERLRLIRRLQNAHLPLAEIRRQLSTVPIEQLSDVAENAADYQPPTDSALDYIESLLKPKRQMFATAVPAPSSAAPAAMPASEPAASRAASPAAALAPAMPAKAPERAQWERISLDPDIELHIRRPLTRQHNKRVERLIAIARQLLEEDQ